MLVMIQLAIAVGKKSAFAASVGRHRKHHGGGPGTRRMVTMLPLGTTLPASGD
jgi:hypothetical protein